jgi:hypothetical protein
MPQLDLLGAHRWDRTVFTTYALSLSFFEAVALDRIVRSNSGLSTILSDIEGVRAALGEHGAQRIGRQYEVEPVSVKTGVFHAKISALLSSTEAHLLVGSGNLTFGGWGLNLEVAEHLVPEAAPDAFRDAADFFEGLATAPHVIHDATDICGDVATRLRQAVAGLPNVGRIRMIHSLERGIGDQILDLAEELGGAIRLVVVSPFWDRGEGITDICNALGLDRVHVHAHSGGCVAGRAGSNWPTRPQIAIDAVALDFLATDSRQLHAKLFEVQCRRGRIVMSGSANASRAALRQRGNVEACVVRVQRDAQQSWLFKPANPPAFIERTEDSTDRSTQPGVVKAALNGEMITGRVFAAHIPGQANAILLSGTSAIDLGAVTIKPEGGFSIITNALSGLEWTGGRLVIRLTDASDRVSEGFVTVVAFAELSQRAGAMASKFMALLRGVATPSDVLAVLEWFAADTSRLMLDDITGGGGDSPQRADKLIPIGQLSGRDVVRSYAGNSPGLSSDGALHRTMRQIWSIIGGPSVGLDSDEENDDGDDDLTAKERAKAERNRKRSILRFDDILKRLLARGEPLAYMRAFEMAQFVAVHIQADHATTARWLRQLLEKLTRVTLPTECRQSIAAAALALNDSNSDIEARNARARIRRIGIDLAGPVPSSAKIEGFLSRLQGRYSLAEKWDRIQRARTLDEQRRAYLCSLEAGRPADGYDDLPKVAPQQWPDLAAALADKGMRRRVHVIEQPFAVCPKCFVNLPTAEYFALKATGIAKGCCHEVLIVSGSID